MSSQVALTTGKSSRRRQFRLKIALILFGILSSLIVAEIGLRLIGYAYPNFYITDATRGFALRPGAEGWYRKEGASYVRINSAGLRDREHTLEKPPATLRIAILGDSYAEALQVSQEETFWSVARQQLQNSCAPLGDRQVEVINFGVSGYGTAQELLTLRTQVWQYAPDLVLLLVTTNNDITDNSRALKKTNSVPYFVRRNGQLISDDSFRRTFALRPGTSIIYRAGDWIAAHSRVIQALTHVAYAWRARRESVKASSAQQRESAPATATSEIGIDNLIYREPSDETWREAWSVTEELLVCMNAETKAHGARFLVFTGSNGIQAHPNRAARADFMRRIGISDDLFYPERRLQSLGAQAGFPVAALAPEFQVYAERSGMMLHGFGAQLGNGHWNAAGHRLAGEMIAARICQAVDSDSASETTK